MAQFVEFCVYFKSTGSNGHHYLSKEFPFGPPPESFNEHAYKGNTRTVLCINQCDISPLPCVFIWQYDIFQTKLPERLVESEFSFFKPRSTVDCNTQLNRNPQPCSAKCVSTFASPTKTKDTRNNNPPLEMEISSSDTDFSFSRHKKCCFSRRFHSNLIYDYF